MLRTVGEPWYASARREFGAHLTTLDSSLKTTESAGMPRFASALKEGVLTVN